jgi:ABC-2 type transport system permease protein
MIRLVRAELLRIRSRRLTWVALGAVLVVILLTQLAVFSSVRPLTAGELEQSRSAFEEAQRDYAQNKAQYDREEQDCRDQGGSAEECDFYEPRQEDYVARTVSDFGDVANLAVTVTVFLAGLSLLFLSASLVGADFSSGALANWLSFLPQRTSVYTAKLVAVVVTGALATGVLAALALALTTVVTLLAGADVVQPGAAWAMVGRGVLLGVVAVVLGFGIAMLTRHTIAAVGAVLAYLFLSFVYNILIFIVPAVQGLQSVLPENQALALLNRGHTYLTYVNEATGSGQFEQREVQHTITMAESGLYWLVLLGALVAVTLVVFRRRDVN